MKLKPKQFEIEAIQRTEDNFDELVAFCGEGKVFKNKFDNVLVRVDSFYSECVEVGQWIIKDGEFFTIKDNEDIEAEFENVE